MSYFDNFLTANQAYVALHGDLRLPIKPKTQVAIVTCMDSRQHLKKELGVDVGDSDFLPFQDVEESVREDMELLKASPLIPEDVVISGAVYDVDTGLISEVK